MSQTSWWWRPAWLLPASSSPKNLSLSMIQKCRISNEVDAGTVGRKSQGWYIKGCSVQKNISKHRIWTVYGSCMLSIFNSAARGHNRCIHSSLNQSHSVVLPASASSISVFRTSFWASIILNYWKHAPKSLLWGIGLLMSEGCGDDVKAGFWVSQYWAESKVFMIRCWCWCCFDINLIGFITASVTFRRQEYPNNSLE